MVWKIYELCGDDTVSNIINFGNKKIGHKIILNAPLKLNFPTKKPLESDNKAESTEEAVEKKGFIEKFISVFKKVYKKTKKFIKLLEKIFITPIRSWYWRVESRKLMGELVSLSLKLNRDNFHVFIRYYGHIDNIEIQVCPRGWDKREHNQVTLVKGELPGYGKYYYKMKPHQLREAMKTLVNLSNLSKSVDHTGNNVF